MYLSRYSVETFFLCKNPGILGTINICCLLFRPNATIHAGACVFNIRMYAFTCDRKGPGRRLPSR